jgi:hypothetical protein
LLFTNDFYVQGVWFMCDLIVERRQSFPPRKHGAITEISLIAGLPINCPPKFVYVQVSTRSYLCTFRLVWSFVIRFFLNTY